MANTFVIILVVVIVIIIAFYLLKSKKEPSYGVESVTEKGETVRSKKEKIVADFLNAKGIDYEYEKEIEVASQKILTDFYLPKYDLYIEYWGLDKVQNKTGDEYRKRKAEKIDLYDKGNLKLLSLDEEDLKNIDVNFSKKLNDLINSQDQKKGGGLKSLFFGTEKAHCTSCGAEKSSTSAFCTNCGDKEIIYCPHCSEPTEKDSKFCVSCGNDL